MKVFCSKQVIFFLLKKPIFLPRGSNTRTKSQVPPCVSKLMGDAHGCDRSLCVLRFKALASEDIVFNCPAGWLLPPRDVFVYREACCCSTAGSELA
jgi:hypothetical protein